MNDKHFCKDCKYYRGIPGINGYFSGTCYLPSLPGLHMCKHPDMCTEHVDYVTGISNIDYGDCHTINTEGQCSKFEIKEVEKEVDLFKEKKVGFWGRLFGRGKK